ncbi:MAG: glycosyltransferase family 9 protein [Candidatus Omnitrophica bacterium]|nr:glycosyltransferase family 9 protein [Candidatus Omnitrophota bacterium]
MKKVSPILLITLSNIGDAVLTTPVLYILCREFPKAAVDVMCGPRVKEIFSSISQVRRVIPYNKFDSFKDRVKLILSLRRRYDLVVDLRHTLIPLLIGSRNRTALWRRKSGERAYMKDVHLARLKQLGINTENADFLIEITDKDEKIAGNLLGPFKIEETLIAMAPGALSEVKRWPAGRFKETAEKLANELNAHIVLVGDKDDCRIADEIARGLPQKILNLCGKTSLMQLAAILRKTRLLITNDSAPMHLATAQKVPVISLFGPTNSIKYGPRGEHDRIIKKEIGCVPCEKAQCRFDNECLRSIESEEVVKAAAGILQAIK